MTDFLPLILLILAIVVCDSISQSCIKQSLITDKYNNLLFISAICIYPLICFLLLKCYSYKSMWSINLIWSVLSIISVTLFGVIIFNEKLSKNDIIGSILCIFGIYFIFLDKN